MNSMLSGDMARFLLAVVRHPLQGNPHLMARHCGMIQVLRMENHENRGFPIRWQFGGATYQTGHSQEQEG